jgi:hypothetical protein
MVAQNESRPDDAVPKNTELCSIPQGCTIVSFVQDMHSSITRYMILSRIVSLLNISHHVSFDNFHHKCYRSIEEKSKAKGDTTYAERF